MKNHFKNYRTNLYTRLCSSLVIITAALCVMIMTGTQLHAQNELYLQPGSSVTATGYDGTNPTLFIKGQLNIAGSGATLTNTTSYIQITGDMINSSGTFTSTGTENFSGSSNQTISGSLSGTNYFGNVIKSNTGNIILGSNIDFYSLTFTTDGTVDASGGYILYVKNPAYNAIAGYTTLRFVDLGISSGSLRRVMNDITSGNWYVFPIGNSTAGYQRIDINLTGGVSGAADVTATLKSGAGSFSIDTLYTSGFPGVFSTTCVSGTHKQWVAFDCLNSSYWGFSGPSTHQYIVRTYTTGCGTRVNRVIQGTPSTWRASFASATGANICDVSTWSTTTPVLGGYYVGYQDFGLAGGVNNSLTGNTRRFHSRSRR